MITNLKNAETQRTPSSAGNDSSLRFSASPRLFLAQSSVSIRVHPWLKLHQGLWLVLSLLFVEANAGAQLAPADDFFNSGAQLYISNNIPAALEAVTNGRALYPDDVKLKKLEELLKQQQQSQSQQNQQQQNQQNQQSQSNQQQQKNQQSQQQQQSQSQQNKEQQNQPAQQKQQEDKSGQKGNEEQQASARQGKEMLPEEAKRLLDAQKGDEQVLQWKPQGKPEDQNRPVKDW
jgi:hypothetical protein